MRGLVACEFSGRVRTEFEKLGWDMWSCDLLDTEIPGQHYKGNIFDILYDPWDILIFHAPCTYLTNSGVRWLYNKDGSKNVERWNNLDEGAKFFRTLLETKHIKMIAGENPIPHKYALERIGQKYTQKIQPWQFGHGETKATCLWLKGLPELKPTNIVDGREQKIHLMPPSEDRWKNRSRTYVGVAQAMASQWGVL